MTSHSVTYHPISEEIVKITAGSKNPEDLLEVLKQIQLQFGFISQQNIKDVARVLNLPPAKVFAVASFYSMLSLQPQKPNQMLICDGPACWLSGSDTLTGTANKAMRNEQDWEIARTSCLGLCDRAPAALVNSQQSGPYSADRLKDFPHPVLKQKNEYAQSRPGELRVMLADLDRIDPDSIESAIQNSAYLGISVALAHSPEEILAEVEKSGLTGRGGAGFPVGRKWRFVSQADRTPKYIICNADESEPLIFKDRVLIDSNPHQILEGMLIAGYATGAHTGYIYIRGEYPGQADRLDRAIDQATSHGWLGENIAGSGYSFHIHVHRGAGAYICGEETALIESLEGKPGEPRPRPPYPPTSGYHGLPTLVNNVESYAAVPSIIRNGAEWFRSLTGYKTPGTKIYMLLGHVQNPGLFEAPFGLTLRQIINGFGGGMRAGSAYHFSLAGGAAGLIVPEKYLDVPIDYASANLGVSLGAGSFLICDQHVSPLSMLRVLLNFFSQESCGKCTPCRVGTKKSFEILKSIEGGKFTDHDVTDLRTLAQTMHKASFCGLGQSVALPMNSALDHFPEYFQPR